MKTLQDFENFVYENMPSKLKGTDIFSQNDIDNVSSNLMRLQKHYAGENQFFGSFMNCIANKDFYNALVHADSINQVMIKVYASYVYNFAPLTL